MKTALMHGKTECYTNKKIPNLERMNNERNTNWLINITKYDKALGKTMKTVLAGLMCDNNNLPSACRTAIHRASIKR